MDKMKDNYERLEVLKIHAENADRAKSEFLTTVSHEIRTPMNRILGMLDFLLDTNLDVQQLEFTKIAQASGTALISLVNDVLDLAKVETGHMDLEIHKFNIHQTVEEVLDGGSFERLAILKWQHRATGSALKFATSGHMLLHVCMHGEASGKAFSKSGEETAEGSDFADTSSDTSNSPSPAAAASSQGDPFMEAVGQHLKKGELQHEGHHMCVSHGDLERGPVYHHKEQHPIVINLSSDKIEAPSSSHCVHLSIACEDTGAGIPKEARACIFKRFVQADKSTARVYGGTGIGLSISQKLVRLMGGKIELVPHIGVGTTFFFTVSFGVPKKLLEEKMQRKKMTNDHNDLVLELQGKRAILVDGMPLRCMVRSPPLKLSFLISEIVELALQKLRLEVHLVTNPTTIMEVVSALFERNCHVKVDKDKLTSLFENWIPPFIQVATEGIYEQQGKLSVWSQRSGSRGTYVACEGHSSSPDTPSDGIAPHVTSYDLHIRKNLVALPALKLPLNTQDHFPAQSSSRRCTLTIAEVAFVEALRKGLHCDVMLVDKHAFGKGSGVELGRFVLKCRFGVKSGDPICQFPPLVLLACKREENEKDLQSLGFSDNICKPIKPSTLATILSKELEAAGVIVRDSQAATRKATAGNAGHNRHHLLIMALTTDVFSNNHAKVKKCGMDGFISKPLQEDQLHRSLQDFLPSTPLLPDPSESTETMQALLDLNNLNQFEKNSQQLHTQQPHFGAEQP
ncbi:unnamed protein product [Sphagnum jensenii]|uniref:Histidine kinase domain-containing protein n=1 Tax=Sphagnum jensenii TaxID=128206 RepID=A0ABP1AZ51_9BRYO